MKGVDEAEKRIAAAARKPGAELDLSGLALEALPESIGKLMALQSLNLSNSQLTALPESLVTLKNLEELFLHENPYLGIPAEVLGKTFLETGWGKEKPAVPKAILDYYFRGRQGRSLNELSLYLSAGAIHSLNYA